METKVTEKISINEDGTMEIAEVTRVYDGDKVIAKGIHRYTVEPGEQLPNPAKTPKSARIMPFVHDAETITAFSKKKGGPKNIVS